MKTITCILLTLLLTSCAFLDKPEDNTAEMASNSKPPIDFMLVYKFKKEKYSMKPWTYVDEEVCGYTYDPWMEQFGQRVCNYGCFTRPSYEYRPWLYETFGECRNQIKE